VRITGQIIDRRAPQSIQKSLSALQEAQLQASSGLRVQNAADDPGAYVSILSADHRHDPRTSIGAI
jgi:flagellin-like hook-associated protein FlgL